MFKSPIVESTVRYVGQIDPILGSNEDFTLNYGGALGRAPMLYGKFPLSAARQLTKHVAKCRIIPPTNNSAVGRIDCSNRQYRQASIAHVGESHCTIVAGDELANAIGLLKRILGVETDIEALTTIGLFSSEGRGIDFPMSIQKSDEGIEYLVARAQYYKDDKDPEGPVFIGAVVKVPKWEHVRSLLGLKTYPFPGYLPHVTIGYVHEDGVKNDIRKQIYQSFLNP